RWKAAGWNSPINTRSHWLRVLGRKDIDQRLRDESNRQFHSRSFRLLPDVVVVIAQKKPWIVPRFECRRLPVEGALPGFCASQQRHRPLAAAASLPVPHYVARPSATPDRACDRTVHPRVCAISSRSASSCVKLTYPALKSDPVSRRRKRAGNFEIIKITSNVPGIEISQDPPHQQSSSYRIDVAVGSTKS